MKKLWIGATLAAVALFVWGFIFWALLPTPWLVLRGAPDEVALASSVAQALPGPGVYVLPHPHGSDEAEAARRAVEGPILQIILSAGRDPMSPAMFLGGFLHMWISALLMGWLLMRFAPAGYRGALLCAAGMAGAAAVWGNLGKPIWYAQPWGFHLLNAVYDFTGWVLAGAVLARFVRREA